MSVRLYVCMSVCWSVIISYLHHTNYLIILYSEVHEYWFNMLLYHNKVCCVTIGLHLTREQQNKK